MRNLILALVVALTSACAAPAFAQVGQADPTAVQNPSAAMTPQGADYSVLTVVSSTATSIVRASSAGTFGLVIPFGALARFSADETTTVCLHMAEPHQITIGAQTAPTAMVMTDSSGPDGGGACFRVGGGYGPKDDIPDVVFRAQGVGSRAGVCTNFITSPLTGTIVFPPCGVSADCLSLGAPAGTTCNTAPTDAQLRTSGVCVTARAVADGAQLVTSLER